MDVQVLRVFTDEQGGFGNPLGVVMDATGLTHEQRQAIARRLAFSETVFVEDAAAARLRIYTPATELPLAGHPLVGTAWLLGDVNGAPPSILRPVLAGDVSTWQEEGIVTWIRARVEDAPPWRFLELDTPAAIDALPRPPGPEYENDGCEFWSWIDREAGVVRARFFAPAYGVEEDEATGSAALRLTALLGRPLTIRQGQGSVLYARPAGDGLSEVGGRVVRDGVRRIEV